MLTFFFSFFLFAVVRMDGRASKPVLVKIYNGVDLYVYFSRHPYLLPDVGTQRPQSPTHGQASCDHVSGTHPQQPVRTGPTLPVHL